MKTGDTCLGVCPRSNWSLTRGALKVGSSLRPLQKVHFQGGAKFVFSDTIIFCQQLFFFIVRTDGWTNGRTDGRPDGRTPGWTDGRPDEQTDGRTDGRADGQTDSRSDARSDGRTEGRTGGRTNERMYVRPYVSLHVSVCIASCFQPRSELFLSGPGVLLFLFGRRFPVESSF